ncbi:alpha/beta hydrolase [Iamia majanohamensis]|uniref:Alpha/beta hydrolase n=1 Tax=Iamia majanohamensis TaxID=467976 RepID=A0AAE9YAN5_9ACTN|nr:alpha/beta hydrolase [Iamia majanohamensis]WCO67653.1 alpha/beta hydrolase [Iamia majanohamensis]
MPVVAEIQVLLDQLAGNPVDFSSITPTEMRTLMRLLSDADEKVAVGSVEDRTIPGPAGEVPVRVYRPEGAPGPAPILVWYHGGGWVIGDLETTDGAARSFCHGAGAVVVSVDYRLAPEHPFPAGPEDAWAALTWVADHAGEVGGDPARIAVGGDSAGGNLAALVALRARDEGGPALVHQLLAYPSVDLAMGHPSIEENGEGYFLTKASMEWFRLHYLGAEREHGDPTSPEVSPLRADDLSGVAPAQVLTAEYDPLRDEGEAYAVRLAEAGVAVDLVPHPGLVHGFLGFGTLSPDAAAATEGAVQRLRQALTA